MNIPKLKIQLLKRLLEVDDPEVLLTISRLLDTHQEANQKNSDSFSPTGGISSKNISDTDDLSGLQKDIDDLFNL